MGNGQSGVAPSGETSLGGSRSNSFHSADDFVYKSATTVSTSNNTLPAGGHKEVEKKVAFRDAPVVWEDGLNEQTTISAPKHVIFSLKEFEVGLIEVSHFRNLAFFLRFRVFCASSIYHSRVQKCKNIMWPDFLHF